MTILVIEDNLADVRVLQELLEENGYHDVLVKWAESLNGGMERLRLGGLDAVLLDMNLPDSRGLNSFLTLHEQFPNIPIVILTGEHDEELAAQTVRAGAQDYLPKFPVNVDLVVRSVRYSIERHRLQKELQNASHRAEHNREMTTMRSLTSIEVKKKVLGRIGMVEEYAKKIRDYLVNRDGDPISTAKMLASGFFDQDRSGKEVVQVHLKAMEHLTNGLEVEKIKLLSERGRMLLLGVLANLVDHYKDQNSGALAQSSPAPQKLVKSQPRAAPAPPEDKSSVGKQTEPEKQTEQPEGIQSGESKPAVVEDEAASKDGE
jgi:DNA-binding response OmpR family regulator